MVVQTAMRRTADALDAGQHEALARRRFGQSFGAKTIGKGLATVAITVIILNELFQVSVINNATGPFAGLIDTVESLGTAALTLTTLAFLVLGGAIAMRFMDRF